MKDEYLRSRRQAKQLSRNLSECDMPETVAVNTLTSIHGHQTQLRNVAIMRGGRIASVAYDGVVRVYERGAKVASLSIRVPVRAVSCICNVVDENDNDVLVVGGADGRIATLSARDGRPICAARISPGPAVCNVDALNCGHLIVATRHELAIIRHEAGRVLRFVKRIRNPHHRAGMTRAFCKHDTLITAGEDWIVGVWDPVSLKRRARLLHTARIVDVMVTPNLITTATDRGEVRLYHNHRGAYALFRVLRDIHTAPLVSVGAIPIGSSYSIMVAAADGTLAFMDEKGDRCIARVETRTDTIAAFALPDSTVLIAEQNEPYCRIATLPNSAIRDKPKRWSGTVASVTILPVVLPSALIAVTAIGILAFYVSRRRVCA